jgi:flagellar assembly protein FliH
MSSSETGGKFYSGRVILGMDTPGPDVMTIQEMEGKKPPTWDEDSCSLLLERVRTKARDAAAEILGEARREAQALKEQARQEGLADGFAQAQSEVERQMREFGLTLGNILEAIQSQEVRVFEAQRQDFARLIRLAVQKAVGVEMAERRKEVLETLLHEALERLESLRQITVRVAPEDVEGMELLLAQARAAFPRLEQWKTRGDKAVASGGVILESRTGMIDNSLDARWKEVADILDRLAGAAENGAGHGGA